MFMTDPTKRKKKLILDSPCFFKIFDMVMSMNDCGFRLKDKRLSSINEGMLKEYWDLRLNQQRVKFLCIKDCFIDGVKRFEKGRRYEIDGDRKVYEQKIEGYAWGFSKVELCKYFNVGKLEGDD